MSCSSRDTSRVARRGALRLVLMPQQVWTPSRRRRRYADSSASSSYSSTPEVTSVGFKPLEIVSFVITHLEILARGELEHHVEQRAFDDRAQATRPGLALERVVGDLHSASSVNTSSIES